MTRAQTPIEIYRFSTPAQVWPVELPDDWRIETVTRETHSSSPSIHLSLTRSKLAATEEVLVFGLVPRCVEGLPDAWFIELATDTTGLRLGLQFHDATWHVWHVGFSLPPDLCWTRCTSTDLQILAACSDPRGTPPAPDSPILLGRLVIQPPLGATRVGLGLRSITVLGGDVRLMAAGYT